MANPPFESKPSKTLATRILLSFGVTIVAFTITLGATVRSEQRAAQDSEELVNGFVPAALHLGRLRSVQSTLASIIDGIPDEKSSSATRDILRTLDSERDLIFQETHDALRKGLDAVGSDETRELSVSLVRELDEAAAFWKNDRAARERLFSAIDGERHEDMQRALEALGQMEHGANKSLRTLADHLDHAMRNVSAAARSRGQRAMIELGLLASLTFVVGIAVSIYTRRLLGPLERVTQRSKAVARGDLTPQPVEKTDDEIGELAAAFERMVASVARAQDRAVANERLAAIGKMAAHVTHEIRNPLSSIGLNLELLEENLAEHNVAGESKALLGAISREVQRLVQLSEEYLRVARLPSPRMEADHLADAVAQIVAFAKPEMDRAGVTIEVAVDEGLPLVCFDEGQIRQALLNVLRNAREAMPDGGTVSVELCSEGMGVCLSIADEGSGIADSVRSRIFDPFFSTKGEGTGLGLAITRQIIEAHGGSIDVRRRPERGTACVIHLPMAPVRTSSSSEARRAADPT